MTFCCTKAAAVSGLLKIAAKLQCSSAELIVGAAVVAGNIEIAAHQHVISGVVHYKGSIGALVADKLPVGIFGGCHSVAACDIDRAVI